MRGCQSLSIAAGWRYIWLSLSTCLLLCSFFLVSCSNLSAGGTSPKSVANPSPTADQVQLARLHWCNKPFIVFRNEHASVTGTPAGGTPPTTAGAPTTLTDWSQVKPNLGFSVYLPVSLPGNSCLVSVSGTLNDPIFGGNFIIGYLLPNSSPLSLSEAPLHANSRDFQCTSSKGDVSHAHSGAHTGIAAATASPTQVPVLLCTGAKGNTSIVFSGRGSAASLKQFFDGLQADVNWVPGS